MFDCIYVNGDSFSARSSYLAYGDFLGEKLKLPVINQAVVGANNDRITRSTLEHIIDLKRYRNPLVIIAWSYVRRQEVWYYGNHDEKIAKYIPDQDLSRNREDPCQPRLITLEWLIKHNKARPEEKFLVKEYNEVHKELTDFYTNLYMFAHTLENHGLNYFIFSAAKNTDCKIENFPYIDSLQQVRWCKHNPKIWKLHDFSIPEWAETHDPDRTPVTNHLSENGHRKFADVLYENIRSIHKEI